MNKLIADIEAYLARECSVLHTMCLEADVDTGTERRRDEAMGLLSRLEATNDLCRTLYSNGCCDECDECVPATCRVIGCEAAVADGATTCSRCQEELDGEYVSLWAIIRGGMAQGGRRPRKT